MESNVAPKRGARTNPSRSAPDMGFRLAVANGPSTAHEGQYRSEELNISPYHLILRNAMIDLLYHIARKAPEKPLLVATFTGSDCDID